MCSYLGAFITLAGSVASEGVRMNSAANIAGVLKEVKTSQCQDVQLPDGDDARVKQGGIANMDALVNSNNVMVYAWGPAFAGQGQIFAWAYDEPDKKIQFWYAKGDHLMRDDTNTIGAGMKTACYWKLG